MTAIFRFLQAPFLGACILVGGVVVGAQAETVDTAPDPAPALAKADLIQTATSLDAELTAVLTELDAEIALQEENAGFGASTATLDRIDGLIARRAALAAKRDELRALLATLQAGD